MTEQTPNESPQVSTVSRGAISGAFWAGVGRWGMSTLSVLTLAVNARLLGPETFGIHALAMAAIAFGEILVSGALAEALTQRQHLTDAERRAGFWIAAPIGVTLWVIYTIAASRFGGAVAPIIPWCAFALPISACASAPVAMLMRDMRFKALSAIELIATGVASLVGISLALTQHGVYSLVFMELMRVSLRCAGAFVVTRYSPGSPPPRAAMASVFHFGAGGLGIALLALADRQIPRLVIGIWLGPLALGVFTLATRLFETLSRLVLGPLSAVAMSVASRLQHDAAALRRVVFSSMRASVCLAAPSFLGLAVVAPLLVPMVFGGAWINAVVPAQIMLLMGLRNSASAFNVAILRGVGNSRAPLITVGLGVALTAILTPLAAPFGLVAISWSMFARNILTWPLGAYYMKRTIGLDIRSQAAAGAPPLAAALVMAIVVQAILLYSAGHFGAWQTLAAAIFFGAFAYAVALLAFARATMREVVGSIRRSHSMRRQAKET